MSKTTSTYTPLAVPKEVMPDIKESQVKKNIEKKQPCIVNVLKEFVEATIIIKCIFNFGINFTISKLLASEPTVEK